MGIMHGIAGVDRKTPINEAIEESLQCFIEKFSKEYADIKILETKYDDYYSVLSIKFECNKVNRN